MDRDSAPRGYIIVDLMPHGLGRAVASELNALGCRAGAVVVNNKSDLTRLAMMLRRATGDGRREVCLIEAGNTPLTEIILDKLGDVQTRIWRIGPGLFGEGWVSCEVGHITGTLMSVDCPTLGELAPHSSPRPRLRLPETGLSAWLDARHRERNHLGRRTPFTLLLPSPLAQISTTEYMIREVIGAATEAAPLDHSLVIALTPDMEPAHVWRRRLSRFIRRAGLVGRVEIRRGERLAHLCRHASHIITPCGAGLAAGLLAGKPVHALAPLPDLPGLTHIGELATFWTAGSAPDTDMAEAGLRVLACGQMRGSLSDPDGTNDLASRLAKRVAMLQSREHPSDIATPRAS